MQTAISFAYVIAINHVFSLDTEKRDFEACVRLKKTYVLNQIRISKTILPRSKISYFIQSDTSLIVL